LRKGEFEKRRKREKGERTGSRRESKDDTFRPPASEFALEAGGNEVVKNGVPARVPRKKEKIVS
jgi:hypothetical protein